MDEAMTISSLLLLLLPTPADAAPDKLAATFSAGTAFTELRAYNDADWVAGILDGEVWLLNARTWESQSIASVCSGANASAAAFYESASDLLLYVGCDDGTVDVVEYANNDGDWSIASSSSSSSSDTGDTGDTDTDTASDTAYDFGAGVLDLQVYDDIVYALVENTNSGGSPIVRSLDPSATSVDSESTYGVTTTNSAFRDGALNENTGEYYVMHSSDNVSVVTLANGALTSDIISTGGSGEDIAVFNNYVLLGGGNRGILTYTDGNYIQVALLDSEYMDDVLSVGSYDSLGGVVAADAENDAFLLYSMSTANLAVTAGLVDSIGYDSSGDPIEMAELDRGYTLAATDAGEVMVLTENPWVEIATGEGDYDGIATGSSVSLTFTSDEDGDWELRIGEDGDVVDSGTATAGESVTASFTVEDGQLSEGLNELWVVVTDGLGNDGHDAFEVVVDEPPGAVTLTADGVGFGDSSIIVQFDGVDDTDLERYDIYVSLQSFSKSDYASTGSGGPAFCTDTDTTSSDTGNSSGAIDCDAITTLSVPVSAEADPDESVYVEIEDVENGYTYYVAVRAVDAGGLEGPMSTVRSVVPQEAYSASQLAGEEGGFCGVPLPASLALAGFGGLLVAVRRRRRGAGLLLSGAVAAGMLASGDALAESSSPWASGSALQVGSLNFDNEALSTVYGTSSNLSLLLAQSFSFRHIVEVEAATGFIRSKGLRATSVNGTLSSDDSRLSVLPVSLSATLRLDFFENQPIVPYASIGGDYWLWRENWDDELRLMSSDAAGGGKAGYHWAVGGQILLDIFEQDQASALEARRGIKDTYLTFEFRENNFSAINDEGLVFDGAQLLGGLRFDY